MTLRRTRAVPAVALAGLALALVGLTRAPAGDTALPVGSSALPVLGVADVDTRIFGAVSEGAGAGETWGYRRLPLDAPPPVADGAALEYGPSTTGSVTPQLAFLRHTDAAGWQVAQTPRDEDGAPYRGPSPNFRSARMTPRGAGLLVGQDGARPAERQLVVLRRRPGDLFRAIPPPPPTVLLPAGVPAPGDPAEALATDRGSGRVTVAVADRADTAMLFIVPVGRAAESAVVVNDGGEGDAAWSREPLALDPGETALRAAGIAAVSPDEAWLAAASPGRPVRLFGREDDGTPEWRELELPATALTDEATAASAGISELGLLGGQAQVITVTSDGVWLDLRFRSGDATRDATVFVRPSAPLGERVESWCDESFCDHPLGAGFSTTDGYRSFAWPGAGAGARVITNPLRPSGQGESNRGTWLRLAGDRFDRLPGGGGNFRASGAFASPDRGWLEGPVEVGTPAPPDRLRQWPVSLRAPLTAVAPAPGGAPGALGTQALAVGGSGAVARFLPEQGWVREFLLSGNGNVVSANLRGVAWPEAARAHAVGDAGAMWLWRADTGLWERDPAAPVGFEGNLLGVAFDPADPQRGYAVGKGGLIMRYDKTWTAEALPDGFQGANVTAITFAGSEAIAVSDRGVLVNAGGGWRVDEQARALLAELRGVTPVVLSAAGLRDGGAVIGGRTFVLLRDRSGAPWRFAPQPLLGQTVVAAGAVREGGEVRAVVSTIPLLQYPVPDPPVEVDPDLPPPLVPPFGLPGDGYLLAQTATGWRDETRTAFAGSGSDRPVKADPVLAMALGTDGQGWAVGGWSGAADAAGRGSSGLGGAARSVRDRVRTGAVYRYAAAGDPAGPAGERAAAISLAPGPVRFAVGGHAQCESACADLANQRIAPDRMVSGAVDVAAGLAADPRGPRAFLFTGGRTRPGSGAEGDAAEQARYAQLLASRERLPVLAATSAGDLAGGDAAAFRSAFAAAPAPFGTASSGLAPVAIGAAPGPGARTHYAFDTTGADGTVRVVVIDNSAGSLAASDAHQNPAEAQEPWLVSVLQDARAKAIPAIVVGSRDLNASAVPPLNVASDGDRIAGLLVEQGASAYLYDRPEENRISRIPAGAATTIPAFGTGTLGYRSPIADSASVGLPDALFGDGGFLLLEVVASARDPQTGRAPVTARLIPVIERLSIQALDGTLLRRSRPALFQGLGRRPIGGDRWGQVAGDGVPSPAGADPYTAFPSDPCRIAGCSSKIEPEYTFSSSAPDVLDFVAQDAASSSLRKPLLGADDKVITDAASGLVCPFNAGAADVTVSAGGRAFSQTIQVLPGSVQRPCGTRPLDPSRIRRVARQPAAAAAPPPPASPPPSVLPALVPPPPPAPETPADRPERPEPRPPAELPFFGPLVEAPPAPESAPPVTPPPPPPGFFANTIPPGGATVRAHEEKREEEAAPEQSQANAVAYRADEHLPLEPFVLGLALLAALAGVSIFRGGRRRDPELALTRLTFDDYERSRRSRRTL